MFDPKANKYRLTDQYRVYAVQCEQAQEEMERQEVEGLLTSSSELEGAEIIPTSDPAELWGSQ